MFTHPNNPSFPTITLDEDELTGLDTNAATIIVRHKGGKESRFFVRLNYEGGLIEAFLETPSLQTTRDNRTTRPLVAVPIDFQARPNQGTNR